MAIECANRQRPSSLLYMQNNNNDFLWISLQVIRIMIKTLTGEDYAVRIGKTASVDALKALVEAVEGTPMDSQRLAVRVSIDFHYFATDLRLTFD